MRQPTLINSCLAVLLATSLVAPTAQAAIFNPHYILSDQEMRAFESMSFTDIYGFLNEQGGLNSYFDVDPGDGLLKGAAQLIDDAAKRYRVNPKYILALLQKESSLIETRIPTQRQLDWAAGYALCDGCSRTSPLATKYKGLAKQIDAGAGWMDWYLTRHSEFNYLLQPLQPKLISGTLITPANMTTAALYNYTPHLHGNRLLWSIWTRWFDPDLGLQLPDGSLVRNDKTGAVGLIENGKLRPIASAAVLASRYAGRNVIDLNDYDFQGLEKTVLGRPIKFADLSLIRTENGDVWLLVGERRRRIASPQAFTKIGFNPEEVEDAVLADILEYAEGAPLTEAAAEYPLGLLAQNNQTGGVYWVESGVKRPIWDRAVLTANFANPKPTPLTPARLEQFVTGEPLRLAEGTLVRTAADPTVYVISNGQRRVIDSEETFLAFGYRWTQVLTASDKVIALHSLGEPISVNLNEPPTDPTAPIVIE